MPARTLKDRIRSLLNNPTTSDVTFVVGEEQVHIPAHSAVLAPASDPFKEMFFGNFNRERVVEIPDASPDVFRACTIFHHPTTIFSASVSQALIKFIYTDEVDLTDNNLASVLSLADKYLVTDLFNRCMQHVTIANVCRFLPLAELYPDLSEHCWNIALKNGYKVLNSEYFLDLPQEQFAKLLGSDELMVNEETVFIRAVDWARHRLEQENRECGPAAIRATLGNALYLIRFPLFDAKEFADGPAASGILSDKDTASLMEWFATQKSPLLFSAKERHGSHVERIIGEFGLVRHFHCDHEAQVFSTTGTVLLRSKCETATASCLHGDGDPRICLVCHQVFCGIGGCSLVMHHELTTHALYFDGSSIFCRPCFASQSLDLASKY